METLICHLWLTTASSRFVHSSWYKWSIEGLKTVYLRCNHLTFVILSLQDGAFLPPLSNMACFHITSGGVLIGTPTRSLLVTSEWTSVPGIKFLYKWNILVRSRALRAVNVHHSWFFALHSKYRFPFPYWHVRNLWQTVSHYNLRVLPQAFWRHPLLCKLSDHRWIGLSVLEKSRTQAHWGFLSCLFQKKEIGDWAQLTFHTHVLHSYLCCSLSSPGRTFQLLPIWLKATFTFLLW